MNINILYDSNGHRRRHDFGTPAIHTRGKKKEETVIEIYDVIAALSPVLEFCGVKTTTIPKWIRSAWLYVSLRVMRNFLMNDLTKEIRTLMDHLSEYTPDTWTNLMTLNKNHPDVLKMMKLRRNVYDCWMKRPVFPPSEAKRLEKEGY